MQRTLRHKQQTQLSAWILRQSAGFDIVVERRDTNIQQTLT